MRYARIGRRVAGVLAATAPLIVPGAVARAIGSPYSVQVKVVGMPVIAGNGFKVVAHGYAAKTAKLLVTLSRRAQCRATPSADLAVAHVKTIIDAHVTGAYSKRRAVRARIAGTYSLCAYLSAPPPAPAPVQAGAALAFVVVS